MAVPFGFSVGDFIAVIGAFKTICVALRSTGGAVTEYQETLDQLKRMQAVVQHVQTLSLSITTKDADIPALVKGICGQASACQTIVSKFVERVRHYDPALGHRAPKSFKHGIWSKMMWGIHFSKELGGMRQIISAQAAAVSMLFQLLQVSLSAEVLKRETVQRRFTEAKFAESSTQVDTSFSELRAQNTQHTRDFQALSTKISEQFAEQGDIFRLITGDIGLGYSTLRTELASLHSRFSQHQENNHLATVQLLNSLQDQLNTQSALIRVCHSLLFDEVRKSDDKPRQNVEQKSEPTDSITDLDRSRATILPPTSQNRAMRRGAILNDLESAYTGKLLQWLRGLFRLSIDLVSIEGRRHPPSKALLRAISKFGSLFHAYIQELYPLLLQLLLYMKFILPRMMLVANSIAIRSPLQLSIIFEDVLGRAHGLPYHYFRNWHTFTSMLEREFVNCPGEEEVVRGDYRLMNSQFYDDALSEENWEQSVFPGTKIIMSIFVRMLRRAKGQCAREGCAGTLESNGKAKTVWFVDLHNRAGWESDT